MRLLIWLLRGVLFAILLGLALKNSGPVELHFFFDAHWQAPLVLVILVALVCGALLGMLAFLPRLLRQRRSLDRLERQRSRQDARPQAAGG